MNNPNANKCDPEDIGSRGIRVNTDGNESEMSKQIRKNHCMQREEQLRFIDHVEDAMKKGFKDLAEVYGKQLAVHSKQTVHRAPHNSMQSQLKRLLEEGITREQIKARADYRVQLIRSTTFKRIYDDTLKMAKDNPTLKNIDFGNRVSINTNDVRSVADLVNDQFSNYVHTITSVTDDPQTIFAINVLKILLMLRNMSPATKEFLMRETEVYENFELKIYYDVEAFVEYFKICLEPPNSAYLAYVAAKNLKYSQFGNFADLVYAYGRLVRKNAGGPEGFILEITPPEIVFDEEGEALDPQPKPLKYRTLVLWLLNENSNILPSYLFKLVLKLLPEEKNIEDISTILLTEETARTALSAAHHQVSRFNHIGSNSEVIKECDEYLEDVNNNEGSDVFRLNAMPNFKTPVNNVLKKVAFHNDKILDKLQMRDQKAFGRSNICFTCGQEGHFFRNCNLNKEREPPFPTPHKSEAFKDFESNKKKFSTYKFTNADAKFHVIHGDLPEDVFVYIGPEGLDGQSEDNVEAEQLFLMC